MFDSTLGFSIAVCPECGNAKVFFSKEEGLLMHCYKCHAPVSITKIASHKVDALCECGNRIKAVTNCKEDSFEFNCKCGYPISCFYNRKRGMFLSAKLY